MSNFDFDEFEQFAKNCENMTKDVDIFLKIFLLKMAYRVLARSADRTNEVTGAMKSSWYVGEQTSSKNKMPKATIEAVNVVGNNLEISIGNSMEYASYVEYGARNRNGSWREGQFMLTISLDEVNKQIPLRLNKEWKAFLKERGVE